MFMFEQAMVGSRKYWLWVGALVLVVVGGMASYLQQLEYGPGLTGLNQSVVWGLYVGQFTFIVGVAASVAIIVLLYYLHNHGEFARATVLSQFLAISAVVMAMLFIFVDMGRPERILNVIRYPHPRSVMFWDMVSLTGFLALNIILTLTALHAEQNRVVPPSWLKSLAVVSIVWAIGMHTVTAFLYAGLPGMSYWLGAIMAPRFLASAFASGPALLILLCLLVRKLFDYDVGHKAIKSLAVVMTYALALNLFFLLTQLFSAFYSQVPAVMKHYQAIYFGMGVHTWLLSWGRISLILMTLAMVMLLIPQVRRQHTALAVACGVTFAGLWLDKGVCLVVCGFTPSPLNVVTSYIPTWSEISVTAGIWALGLLMVTVFYKIALSIEETIAAEHSAAVPRAGQKIDVGAAISS
jgi:Ni/Fe-hydrogenase subunit HybB-like protein